MSSGLRDFCKEFFDVHMNSASSGLRHLFRYIPDHIRPGRGNDRCLSVFAV